MPRVLGYVVAAIFVNVKGNWRYIVGSSVVFSTIMFAGYVSTPQRTVSRFPRLQD